MSRPTAPAAAAAVSPGWIERAPAWVVALVVTLAVAIAYQPVWTAGFIWDDDQLVTANPLIKSPGGLWDFWFTTKAHDYWPVVSTSFWIEWRLWGMNAAGYHATNLVLHALAAVQVWALLRRLRIPGAAVAALLFALHPVNVESVAWIAQRKNTLSMVFYLLAIHAYLRGEVRDGPPGRSTFPGLSGGGWYALSLAAFALALLSKGSVAMLPVVLLGVVWWQRPLVSGDWLRVAPFAVLAAVLVKVNIWFQTHGWDDVVIRTAGLGERLAGAGAVFWFYLSKALWPTELMFIYPQWRIDATAVWWWVPLGAAVVTLAGLAWGARGRARPVFFAYAYFGVALVPAVGLVDVYFMKYSLVADHYQHLAIVGVIALGAAGWSTWHAGARGAMQLAACAALGVAVLALGGQTWRLAGTYRDGETLYRATLATNPDCWLAHNNLGASISDAQPDEARKHFEAALRLKPDYPDAHLNLGRSYELRGDLPAALAHYETAVKLRPKFLEARVALGTALRRAGRLPEALRQLEEAVRLNADYVPARYNLANALLQAERFAEAAAHYRAALRVQPEFGEAQANLGNALLFTDDLAGAERAYREAARLRPTLVPAYSNLATVLARQGRLAESLAALEAAQRLAPTDTGLAARAEETRAALRAGENR
jgi:tetratricopeptide (TPR) repeat protein